MKRLLPLVLLVCLAVACGSGHACSDGGELVFRAVPQRGHAVTPAGMELVRQIMTNRVTAIGVGSPTISIRGSDEIVVEYAGTHAPKLPRIVGVRGQLQFFDFEKDLASPTVKNGNPTPYPTLFSLLTAVKGDASKGTPEAYYLFGTKTKVTHPIANGTRTTKRAKIKNALLAGPAPTEKQLLAPYRGHKQPSGTTILAVPASREVVVGGIATQATQPVKVSPNGRYWYLFTLPPEISGDDLKKSAIQAETDPNTGQPEVILAFNGSGAKEFQRMTKEEWARGRLVAGLHGSAGQPNPLYAQHNAIVLDGQLESAPYIDYTDNSLSLGIAGSAAVLSNLGSIDAANSIALVLQSGSLPYRFEQVSSKLCRS